jgi:hypothetical protein
VEKKETEWRKFGQEKARERPCPNDLHDKVRDSKKHFQKPKAKKKEENKQKKRKE